MEPGGASTQDLIEEALAARAAIKFSGESGAPVLSGITGDAAEAEGITYGLLRGCFNIVDKLPSELFNPHAAVRPCGKLDTYEAVSMLICEVVGWPFFSGPRAQKLGLNALKKKKEIASEQAKARAAARRKGQDAEAAAAAVLRQPAKLKLPPEEEAGAAPAPEPAAAAAIEPAAAPAASAGEPAPVPEDTGMPEPRPVRAAVARAAGILPPPPASENVRGSMQAAMAIYAADACERCGAYEGGEIDFPDDPDDAEWPPEENQKTRECARRHYHQMLMQLKLMYPEVLCSKGCEIGECVHGRRCPCGEMCEPWPWHIVCGTAAREKFACECPLIGTERDEWTHGHEYLRRGAQLAKYSWMPPEHAQRLVGTHTMLA